MATYAELYDLSADATLLKRVATANWIQADVIKNDGAATANQKKWASRVLALPDQEAGRMLRALIASEKSRALLDFTDDKKLTDAIIQTAVAATVDMVADSIA